MRNFVPIEKELGLKATPPVEWYALIREMEEFRERTGMGLAGSWTYVHQENYKAARNSFDQTVRDYTDYEERISG